MGLLFLYNSFNSTRFNIKIHNQDNQNIAARLSILHVTRTSNQIKCILIECQRTPKYIYISYSFIFCLPHWIMNWLQIMWSGFEKFNTKQDSSSHNETIDHISTIAGSLASIGTEHTESPVKSSFAFHLDCQNNF